MNITCELTSLAKEVNKACSFAIAKNSLSMTSCILLDASGTEPKLTIKATDGKMNYVSTIPVSVTQNGAAAVFADKLSAVLKNMPSGPVTLIEKDGKLTVEPASQKNIKVNIKTLDASKFPEISTGREPDVSFTMKMVDFLSMADSVSFSVSDDNGRAFLTGVCIESKNGNMNMVATDGRRLAINRVPTEVDEFKGVIVPVKFFQQLKGIDGETVTINIGNGEICAITDSCMVSSALISGTYPNYERVIPTDADQEIKVNASDLDRAVTLISIMADSKTKRIFLEAEEGKLMVSGEDSNYGDSTQVVSCQYDSEPVKSSFNVLLLSPCLKRIATVDALIRFPKSQRAWVFSPTGDDGIKYVIAPMGI